MRSRVYSVKEVTAALTKSIPPILVISAKGEASSSGWTCGGLSPVMYLVQPGDGVLDVDFTAEGPNGISNPALQKIEANASFPVPHWVKGVRVLAASNKMEAKWSQAQAAGDGDPFPLRRHYPWAGGEAAE